MAVPSPSLGDHPGPVCRASASTAQAAALRTTPRVTPRSTRSPSYSSAGAGRDGPRTVHGMMLRPRRPAAMTPPPPRWSASLGRRRRFVGLAEGIAEVAENTNKIVVIRGPALAVAGGALRGDDLADVGRR